MVGGGAAKKAGRGSRRSIGCFDDQIYTIAAETNSSIEYILYKMPYIAFLECINWIAMYKFGYTRKWITQEEQTASLEWKVWDEANNNWIDFVPNEIKRYRFEKSRNCYVLPRGN